MVLGVQSFSSILSLIRTGKKLSCDENTKICSYGSVQDMIHILTALDLFCQNHGKEAP